MNKSGSVSIKDHLRKLLSQHFSTDSHFILGVSGGPDSMALLYLFHELKLSAQVVHINYGLRGASSEEEQELVEGMAFEWGFDCISVRLDADEAEGENFQNWAREQRYRIFRDLKQEAEAVAIAVAHHKDDQVETILQKLLRGGGVAAWKGMESWNGEIFRPLLSFTKEEILDYCRSESIPFRVDQSNLRSDYARNFLRGEFADKMNSFFPGWEQNILELPEQAQLTGHALDFLLQESSGDRSLNLKKLAKFSPVLRRAVIKRFLEAHGVRGISKGLLKELEDAAELETGKAIELSEGLELVRDRNELVLKTSQDEFKPVTISREAATSGGFSLRKLHFSMSPDKEEPDLFMDGDRMGFPLTLRRWEKGDRFVPFGMKGRQTIADHLTNRKVSSAQKEKALVLCGTDGNIYAIFFPEGQGGTISELVRCTERTKNYFKVKFTTTT